MNLDDKRAKEVQVIPANAAVIVRMTAYVLANGDMLFSVSSAPGVSEELLPDILLRMRETAEEGLRELKAHGHEPTFAVLTDLEVFDINAMNAKDLKAAVATDKHDDCPCSLCKLRRTLQSDPNADKPDDAPMSELLANLKAEISKLPGYKQ